MQKHTQRSRSKGTPRRESPGSASSRCSLSASGWLLRAKAIQKSPSFRCHVAPVGPSGRRRFLPLQDVHGKFPEPRVTPMSLSPSLLSFLVSLVFLIAEPSLTQIYNLHVLHHWILLFVSPVWVLVFKCSVHLWLSRSKLRPHYGHYQLWSPSKRTHWPAPWGCILRRNPWMDEQGHC